MNDLAKLMDVTLAMTDKALSRWNRCKDCNSIMIGKECEECKADRYFDALEACPRCGEKL